MPGSINFVNIFGAFGVLLCAGLIAAINSLALWLVMNHVLDVKGATYRRCLVCSALLVLLLIPAGLVYALIPWGPIGGVLAVAILAKGSQLVIEGLFELTRGGLTAVAIYLLVTAAVWMSAGAMLRPSAAGAEASNAEFADRLLAARRSPGPVWKELGDDRLRVIGVSRDLDAERDLPGRDPRYKGLEVVVVQVETEIELMGFPPGQIQLCRAPADSKSRPGGYPAERDLARSGLARVVPAKKDGGKYLGGSTFRADGSPGGGLESIHPEAAAHFPGPRRYYLYFAVSPAAAGPWWLALQPDPTAREVKALGDLSGLLAP